MNIGVVSHPKSCFQNTVWNLTGNTLVKVSDRYNPYLRRYERVNPRPGGGLSHLRHGGGGGPK